LMDHRNQRKIYFRYKNFKNQLMKASFYTRIISS
jgi:hypothetical protein